MRVTFISDTHSKEGNLKLPGGDILIFSGDCMTNGYNDYEIDDFLWWLGEQQYKYKICIAGNHDRYFETHPEKVKRMFGKLHDKSIIYLYNDTIEIEGLKIYGTPYQPYFCNWGFNIKDPLTLYTMYKHIPENLDILITHCPPYKILDRSHLPRPAYGRTGEEPLGSEELSRALDELTNKPKYHCFGHIHGDGGEIFKSGETTYINASVCDENYNTTNEIITLDI